MLFHCRIVGGAKEHVHAVGSEVIAVGDCTVVLAPHLMILDHVVVSVMMANCGVLVMLLLLLAAAGVVSPPFTDKNISRDTRRGDTRRN